MATAAVLSTQQDRALDLACLVVPGAACAIADAILRRRAADAPSSFCCQLRGQLACGRQLGHRGYGLSCETFATQTAAIEAHAPALAVCRSAVLDYFNSPDQRGLEKIMAFEDAFELRPGRPTVALLRNLCRELSLARCRCCDTCELRAYGCTVAVGQCLCHAWCVVCVVNM